MSRDKKRTVSFLVFLSVFFLLTGLLTFYSGKVYLRTLPKVDTVMPECSGLYKDGRMTYWVPGEAVHRKDAGTYYVHAARYTRDDLGQRYQLQEVAVWILERSADGKVLVDGIIWEEPIVIHGEKGLCAGDYISI